MSVTFKTSDQTPTPFKNESQGMVKILSNLETYKNEVLGEVIQASSGNDDNIMKCYHSNGLVDTVMRSYNHHHNLVLRPDDVWMSVLTQFSCYVDKNAEALRSKFVAHKGKKKLEVKTGGSLRSVHFGELAKLMTEKIHENLVDGQVRDWILPNFTTTTNNDTLVASVVMMSAMKSYFSYKMTLCCGIPNVTLLGTPEDWKKLRQRLEKLIEYDLDGHIKEWYSLLVPIFDEFVNSSEEKHNLDFWSRVCNRIGGGSGPSYISGWISSFCVFTSKGEWQGGKRSVSSWGKTTESKWPIIDTSDIPPGYVTVPVEVNDNGTTYDTMMFAGSFAMARVNETSIRPRLDWALALINKDAIEKQKESVGW